MSPGNDRSHHVVALMAGRYELVRELDASSDVHRWEAYDTALQRSVLLEFLPHALADMPDAVDRFWRSARSSARSNSAVGERVLDAGTDTETGRVFVVREWSTPSVGVERHDTLRLPIQANAGRRPGRTFALAGVAIVLAAVMLVVRPGVEGWLAWINEPFGQTSIQPFVLGPAVAAQPTASAPTPAVAPTSTVAVAKANAVTPAATRAPTSVAGVTRRIVNTDGRGVALRASPGGDRLPGKGYDEGVTVQAFETRGEWTRIQGSDGRQGWVLSVTLAP